ncbi:MAG: DUF3467 domain-containing protein [Bryobacteraceae bacterium]|jgi:hypothetical protein
MAEKQVRTIKDTVGTEDCYTTYANFGSIVVTPFDIQIVFADLLEQGGELVPHARARVIMTPEHASLLVQALAGRLKAYTDTNGPLRKLPIGPSSTAQLSSESDRGDLGTPQEVSATPDFLKP